MLAVILRRCLGSIPVLFILSVLSFAIIRSLPGDPVDVLLGSSQRDLPPQQLKALRNELGLDKSPAQQYCAWIKGVVAKGELGRSYKDSRQVSTVIGERLPATILLVGSALAVSFTLGIGWGLFMAYIRRMELLRPIEGALVVAALVLYSAPSFWVGFLVIALVTRIPACAGLPILGLHDPGQAIGFAAMLNHLFLPSLVLASRRTAKVALFVRASTLEELSKDYVTSAFSKGLSYAAVLFRHVARNSLLPVVSLVGLSLPALLGGSVLVETVFGWPGMGKLIVDATFGRNYPILLALILIYGALVIASNLLADIAQILVDPRQRESALESAKSGG